MPDGTIITGPPLLMDERAAARFCSMGARDFRLAVQVGLLPAGRTPQDFARAGLIDATLAARLATLGPLWHRVEIEARAAMLWGLEGQAAVGQSARRQAARDALHDFQPPAARQGRPPRR